MSINPYILCEALSSHTMKKINSSRYTCNLSYVTIYIPGIIVNEKTIYLLPNDTPLPQPFLDKGTWIMKNSISRKLNLPAADIIGMPENYPIQKLYDQVCHIMDIYNQWELTMKNALADGCDAHELCKIGVPFMRNPLMITTDDGEILGVGLIRGEDYSKQLREQETDYLNKQRIEKVYRNAQQFLFQREPVFYYLDDSAPTLMFNLFVEDEHKGILYVDAWNKQFNDGDYTRICIFGKYLEIYIRRLTGANYKPLNRFRRELSRWVTYEQGDRKIIGYYLRQFGWQETDEFICGSILEIGEEESWQSDRLCREYEQTFKDNCITFQDSQIYMICNRTKINESIEEIKYTISKINQKYHVSSGLSTVFPNFFLSREYFMQAKASYEAGCAAHETKSVYGFDEYRLKYLLHFGVAKISITVLLPKELNLLYEYDKKNQTDYLETIGMYNLCNQNVSQTAERLFMHRSTLKYRLKKIEELAGKEIFEEKETGLVAAMVYRYMLMKEEGEKNGD